MTAEAPERAGRNRPTTRAGRQALTEAAAAAAVERSRALIYLQEGGIDLETLLAMANDNDPAALRKIKLSQVLDALPGITSAKRDRVLRRLGERFKISGRASNLTIDWLINRRSDGRRIEAFVHAIADHDFGSGHTIWTVRKPA